MKDEIKEFAAAIGATEPAPNDNNYKAFRRVFKRSNYFILDGKFVIIKISRIFIPIWGVGKQFIDLCNMTENYFLILLTSNKEGWCFCKSEINNNINSEKWRLRRTDDNYQIDYPLPNKNSFMSPKQLLEIVKSCS